MRLINVNTFKNSKLSLVFIGIMLMMTTMLNAQEYDAKAGIDVNSIKIGDQINLTFNVRVPKTQGIKIGWPSIPDTLPGGITIVQRSKIDTVKNPNQSFVELTQKIILTSFEAGNYAIKPFKFIILKGEKDTLANLNTETLFYTVATIPVDTVRQPLRDIKAPLNTPISLDEILVIVLIVLGCIIVVFSLIYLIFFWKKRSIKSLIPKKPERPAHEIALERLNALNHEKLWQQGKSKLYYTKLTDVLRFYLENRYQITAMEQTTDEILISLKGISIPEIAKENLKDILVLADFVKFAKAEPIIDENEKSMKDAIDFVQTTKLEQVVIEEKEKTNTQIG